MKGFVIRNKNTGKYVYFGEIDRDFDAELINATIFPVEEDKKVWIKQAKIDEKEIEFEVVDVELKIVE